MGHGIRPHIVEKNANATLIPQVEHSCSASPRRVKRDHLMATGLEMPTQVSTDKPSSSCDEDLHRCGAGSQAMFSIFPHSAFARLGECERRTNSRPRAAEAARCGSEASILIVASASA